MNRLYKSFPVVHEETPLIGNILYYGSMIRRRRTIADICGCSPKYVSRVLAYKRLRHQFVGTDTILGASERLERGQKGKGKR